MRLYNDRPDILTPGQWYWCPPGALVVPYLIRFVSQNWDRYDDTDDLPLGEVKGRGAWVRGDCPPQFQGKHFCGSEEVWLNGIKYADRPGLPIGPDGVPTCCQAEKYDLHVSLTARGYGDVTLVEH